MDGHNIRITEISDPKKLTAVAELAKRIFPETYRELISADQIIYMMKMMYNETVLRKEFADGVNFALISDGNTPIGYISWHDAVDTGKVAVKLEKLYLDFAYHHQGIGNQALQFMIETAKNAGAFSLLLNVNKNNVRAQKAYMRAGFVRYREEKNPIGNGFFMDDYVMRHDLHDAKKEE